MFARTYELCQNIVEPKTRCPHDAHNNLNPWPKTKVISAKLELCFRKQAPEARPGALYIKKHLEVLEGDLKLTSNESYRQSQMSWRQDCEYDEYEFDMEEIKQWCKDLECYRLLQMRYGYFVRIFKIPAFR